MVELDINNFCKNLTDPYILENAIIKAYENLAIAIVESAAIDYELALYMKNNNEQIEELEKFFRSKYFSILTTVNGEYLMKKIREKVNKGI